jgi:hypothetical protein
MSSNPLSNTVILRACRVSGKTILEASDAFIADMNTRLPQDQQFRLPEVGSAGHGGYGDVRHIQRYGPHAFVEILCTAAFIDVIKSFNYKLSHVSTLVQKGHCSMEIYVFENGTVPTLIDPLALRDAIILLRE